MYNIPKEFAGLYLKAVDILKKIEEERTEYEKRLLEVVNKYSFISVPGFLSEGQKSKQTGK